MFEKAISALLAQLGVTPEQVRAQLQSIVTDASTVKNEVLAAKQGFGEAAHYIVQRLDAIDARLARIEAMVQHAPDDLGPPALPFLNGSDHDG